MNKIEKLISELCPDGVVYKELSKIAEVSGAGVDKKIIDGEKSVILLNFMDVFRNQYIDSNTPKMRVTASDIKIIQCNVLKGDIFITPSSEIKNEIGFSAMSIEDMPEVVYSYHIMRIRLNENNFTQSMFINYLFRSEALQEQINKQSKGITRFGLTKTQWEKIQIPVPPLQIQQEIVNILDKFTQLEAELEAELEARKKQYEYYRNELLNFEGKEVEWKTLGEVGKCHAGATPRTGVNEYWENGTIPWMSSGEVNKGKIFETEKKITQSGYDNCSTKMVPPNTVVIALAGQGKTRGTVAITRISLCTNQSLCSVIVENENVNSDYVFYYLKTQYQQLRSVSSGDGTRGGLNLQMINNYKIPIPSLTEQERIVYILDKFDTLVNDISQGLPAEIEARRKQYEYYRGKLLDFKNVNNG